MTVDYIPQQLLKITFASDELINIRITVNNTVKIIQCRTEMTSVHLLDLTYSKSQYIDGDASGNVITIENLSKTGNCYIKQVELNYLDITKVMHHFSKTYHKDTMSEAGNFVAALSDSGILKISIDWKFYEQVLPLFRDNVITWSGLQESNLD